MTLEDHRIVEAAVTLQERLEAAADVETNQTDLNSTRLQTLRLLLSEAKQLRRDIENELS